MSRVEDAFVLVERLHQRFDYAFDRAEKLSALIAEKIHTGADVTDLMGKLKEAEAEKMSTLAALRLARLRKSVPMSAATAPSGFKGGPHSSGQQPIDAAIHVAGECARCAWP